MDIKDFKPLGGKSRRYVNVKTGQEISRRQYDTLRGIDYEAKALANRQKDIKKALSRPARGRTKATSESEVEQRLRLLEEKEEIKRTTKIERASKSLGARVKPKVIRPQLLRSGRRAEKIEFTTYAEYKTAVEQMRSQKLRNGKRLISWYSLGLVGFSERDGRKLASTVLPAQSPTVLLTEKAFNELTVDYLISTSYFIFSHYFLHLHFNNEYAEYRMRNSNQKRIRAKGL